MAQFEAHDNDNEEILPISIDGLFGEENAHELVTEFVIAEKEGALGSDEIQKFKRHLSSCKSCSEKYTFLTRLLQMVESSGNEAEIAAEENESKVAAQSGST